MTRACGMRSYTGAPTDARSLPAKIRRDGNRSTRRPAQRRFDPPEIQRLSAHQTELLGMDATGNQNAVQTGRGGADDVGANAVADSENARTLADPEQDEAFIVDRAERLAVRADDPPAFLVPLCEGAGAEGEPAAVQDNKIGIGANHRKVALQCPLQQWRVIVDRVIPTSGSGVEDELRFLSRLDELERQPLADPDVALRTDVQALPAERRVERILAPEQVLPGLLARGHHMMIEVGRHADPGNAIDHIIGAPRGVGQQHDSLICGDQGAKAIEDARQRGDPVVNDTPQVDNKAVIGRSQCRYAANQSNFHGNAATSICPAVSQPAPGRWFEPRKEALC